MVKSKKTDAHPRKIKRIYLIVVPILIIGIIFTIIGAYHLGYMSMNFFNISSDDFTCYSTIGFSFLAPGMFMILPAIFLLAVANMGKMTGYIYEEGGRALNQVSDRAIDGYGRIISKSMEAMTKGVQNAGGIKLDINKSKEHVIKIRCQACDTLNDENAKFCDVCGQQI